MSPIYREAFIAGVVIGCVALGVLLSALIFSLVRHSQQQNRARIEDNLSITKLRRKPTIGK
jgi:hypothetical protein